MGMDINSNKTVFISYAREDVKAARRLYKELKNVGLKPWLDEEDLLAGQDYEKEIKKAIENSTYFIPLFSSTSVKKRGFIQKEFKFALKTLKEILEEIPEEEIFVIPVRLDDCMIPLDLRRYHYVDLFPTQWKNGIQKVLEAMGLKNAKNVDLPPPKLNREKESLWKNLLKSLNEKKFVPFIGEETLTPLISSNNHTNLSTRWAEEYGYPLDDSSELSHVAQFIAIDNGNDIVPKNDLSEILSKIEPPDFSLDSFKDTPYAVLADLKLPIYMTTNYDHFMEAALISRGGRQPVSDFCRWNDYLLKDEVYMDLSKNFSSRVNFSFSQTKLSSILDQNSEYKPTVDRPLVYHLYGDIVAPESMVLTEKDYFDFVINLHSHQEITSLPNFILNSLARSSLMFIGYNLEEISFRVIFQGFISLQKTNNRPTSIAVHVPPEISKMKAKLIMEYLSLYTQNFYDLNIQWNKIDKFISDLNIRWTKYRNEK